MSKVVDMFAHRERRARARAQTTPATPAPSILQCPACGGATLSRDIIGRAAGFAGGDDMIADGLQRALMLVRRRSTWARRAALRELARLRAEVLGCCGSCARAAADAETERAGRKRAGA